MNVISYIFADISDILGYLDYFQISQASNLSDGHAHLLLLLPFLLFVLLQDTVSEHNDQHGTAQT